MISDSNEQLQQELEHTLLKPHCHSWWISKTRFGREDTLEERYAIKFCFKLGKNRVSGISTRTMHQSTSPSLSQTIRPRWASRQFVTLLIVQTLLPVTFAYSQSSEAVLLRKLRRWKRLWRMSLICSHKRTSMEPSRSFWNGTKVHYNRRRLLQRGLEFHVCTINKSAHTKKVWKPT